MRRAASANVYVAIGIGVATVLGFACGNDFDENGGDPNGADGGNGFGDGASGDGSGGDGGGPSPTDTCGGKPCANYTGAKEFVEPGAPGN